MLETGIGIVSFFRMGFRSLGAVWMGENFGMYSTLEKVLFKTNRCLIIYRSRALNVIDPNTHTHRPNANGDSLVNHG